MSRGFDCKETRFKRHTCFGFKGEIGDWNGDEDAIGLRKLKRSTCGASTKMRQWEKTK
jgi:hypothetical protein